MEPGDGRRQLDQPRCRPVPSSVPAARRSLPLAKLALAAAALLALLVLGRAAGAYLPRVAAWIEGLGALGPAAFVAGYALATVAFIPGTVLTLAGGALFGLVEGTIYVLLGAVLGSVAAFSLARYAARDAVTRWVDSDARFAAIDRAIEREGRRIVFLLRLSPVFPFNLLNYALGLTRARLVDYILASAGMLPGTLLYVYSGKIAGDVAVLAGGAGAPRGAGHYAVIVLGFAATVIVTVVVTRAAQRALREATCA